MKYKEVAEILHISPRTVQTQLFRAIARLRLTLRPYLENRSGRKVPSWIPLLLLLSLHA
jgi:RNA polymerase sigma-70 factor (ECF subfamily)